MKCSNGHDNAAYLDFCGACGERLPRAADHDAPAIGNSEPTVEDPTTNDVGARRSTRVPRKVTGARVAVGVAGALFVVVVIAATSGALSGGSGGADNTHPGHQLAIVHVIYELSGSATSADITIATANGGQSQQQGVDVPLTNKAGTAGIRFSASPGDFLYISAQNTGDGTLTCRIKVEGVVVAENTSSGEYAIATCDATA